MASRVSHASPNETECCASATTLREIGAVSRTLRGSSLKTRVLHDGKSDSQSIKTTLTQVHSQVSAHQFKSPRARAFATGIFEAATSNIGRYSSKVLTAEESRDVVGRGSNASRKYAASSLKQLFAFID